MLPIIYRPPIVFPIDTIVIAPKVNMPRTPFLITSFFKIPVSYFLPFSLFQQFITKRLSYETKNPLPIIKITRILFYSGSNSN